LRVAASTRKTKKTMYDLIIVNNLNKDSNL